MILTVDQRESERAIDTALAAANPGYDMRRGHPCLYDALRLAIRECPSPPASYLEIGVSDGASLLTVLTRAPHVRSLLLCDPWAPIEGGSGRGSHAHIDALLRALGYSGGVTFLDGDSRELLPRHPTNEFFDLATIDGNHSYECALADLTSVWPRLRPGAVLVLDDYERVPIVSAWTEHVARTRSSPELLFELRDESNRTLVARKP